MANRTYREQSDVVKKYFARGLAEGEAIGQAKAVIVVLGARGLPFTAEERDKIAACTDLALLEHWVRRAVTCASVAELFAD